MKKIIAYLLAISIICGVPQFTVMAKDTDGYYIKLEETDAKTNVGFNQSKSLSSLSGGSIALVGTKTAPSSDGYYLEFEVDIKKTDNYVFWLYGGNPSSSSASDAKIVIDGITTINDAISGSKEYIDGINISLAYGYTAAVPLSKGSHTIKYIINATAVSSEWYVAALDFLMLMPEEYTWTPSKTELPQAPKYIDFYADGYAWLEETDYTARNGFSDTRNGTAYSGSSAASVGTTSTPSGDGYYLDYYLNVPESGSYDIWVHGSAEHEWASPAKLQLDGELVAMDRITYDEWDSHWVYCWNKATVTLEEGHLKLRYLIDTKRAGDSEYYFGLLDMICIVPTEYGWIQSITNKPSKPEEIAISPDKMVWIDANDASGGNGTELISNDLLNGSEGAVVMTSTPPANDNPYYLEFKLNSANEAKYDIFLRGSSNSSVWNSEPTIDVNGTEYKITGMGYDEGWVNTHYHISWSKVENVTLPSGSSTLKWIIKTPRQSGSEYYVSVFDAFVILPHGAPFKPVSNNIELTKLDGELSVNLAGLNILSPRDDVSLPSETVDGKSILWSTSDASIFGISGQIKRNWYDNPVTITAVLDDNAYTRNFDVVVPRLVPFILDGKIAAGDTSINVTVYFDEEAADMDTTVIPVLYNSEKQIKHIETIPKSFSQDDNYLDIDMPLEKTIEDGDMLTVFIWDSLTSMTTASPKLTLGSKFLLKPFEDNVCFHIDAMQAYLNDSYENIAEYADGKSRSDNPLPITFRWSWIGTDEAPKEYTLMISENAEMENPKEYTTSTESCDVYNLKVDTKYYWTVSARDENGDIVISDVTTLKTEKKAPRNLYIGGGFNARDIGGWDTLDGSQVKQGYLFRSGRLNYISGETLKSGVNSAGIDTMVNDLGIKTEIDIRLESEMPLEYTESVLGADINYVRAPMNYQGDYLSANKESIKAVFGVLSNPDNYPIVYHCAAGADRTGAITYLINGLLGVSQEDLFRDYLITNFTAQGFRPISNISSLYVKTIDDYTGETLSEKIYNYLNEVIEVPAEQLDFIIEYLRK